MGKRDEMEKKRETASERQTEEDRIEWEEGEGVKGESVREIG